MAVNFKPNWGGLLARIVLGVGAIVLFALLFWLVFGRGGGQTPETAPAPEPLPLSPDEVQAPPVVAPAEVGVGDEGLTDSAIAAEPSKSAPDSVDDSYDLASSGWRLVAIDDIELGSNPPTIRCRTMSTDRRPDGHVINQLRYRIAQTAGRDAASNLHISQINNYYRCDLDLTWQAFVSGYSHDDCLDLGQIGQGLQLITGRGSEAKAHPVLPPWAAIGLDCPQSPGFAGDLVVRWQSNEGRPAGAEISYYGTFRAFIPKTDYARVVSSLQVDDYLGQRCFCPVRIERL